MSAYYKSTTSDFLATDPNVVLGALARSQTGVTREQRGAWKSQIAALQRALGVATRELPTAADWHVLIEYQLPRLERRLDAVILARDAILLIEFKMGVSEKNLSAARDQLENYALDLRDFHAETRGRLIVPILCVESAQSQDFGALHFQDNISNLVEANEDTLGRVIVRITMDKSLFASDNHIDTDSWDASAYSPVPTLIDAAQRLYSAHTVEDIHSALSNKKNLTVTADRIVEIASDVRRRSARAICFVTGVPGSGKTLTGLNAVHDPRLRLDGRASGAFLSGNTPLVAVLREALARDYARAHGGSIRSARQKTRAEIQRLLNFLEEYLDHAPSVAPHEHLIVFDEAQRAWDADYGEKKFGREASEPSLFLEIMSRHEDWCVIIALVGGGQEINRGEGGLSEWGDALTSFHKNREKSRVWEIYASPHAIQGTAVTAGGTLFRTSPPSGLHVIPDERLHLEVSVRSHRCEVAAEWVDAVLDGRVADAKRLASSIETFPIYLTRDLQELRSWLLRTTRGTRRCGLLASSGARRLRAYGLGVSVGATDLPGVQHWYLADRGDVRSCYALEVTANEYGCQGLEVDRAGVCWGGDMIWSDREGAWVYREFKGSRWYRSQSQERRDNTKNTYRVLLTRAREAMALWIPPGDVEDPTRPPAEMDATARYLSQCGVEPLDQRSKIE